MPEMLPTALLESDPELPFPLSIRNLHPHLVQPAVRLSFGVDEELAQNYYDYLKSAGIVGRMGMVNHEKD